MNKFKKIGLSALAGSLVATSAIAGEISVAGSASMSVEHINGGAANAGKSFSMGNQLTFTGGGELDNGLNVSVSFVLDQNDDSTAAGAAYSGGPFDSHSVSIGNDTFGTLTLHGEGGSSAESALDTTAAGDIWDNFDRTGDITVRTSATGDNLLSYKLPTLVDDLSATVSYLNGSAGAPSATAWGLTYTGIDGLSVSAGRGDGATELVTIESTTYKASYAFGPITLAYSSHDYDHTTATSDQETKSWAVSYTVSDELSVTYGSEEIDDNATASVEDVKTSSISASYTTGGMTITAAMQQADNMDGTTATTSDLERWSLGASFAF